MPLTYKLSMTSIEKEKQKVSEYQENLKEDTKNAIEDDLSHGLIGNLKPPYDALQMGRHKFNKWKLERKREREIQNDKCGESEYWIRGHKDKRGVYIHGHCRKYSRP